MWYFYFQIKKGLFIIRERESESLSGEETDRTESTAGSRLWAVSTEPDAGLEPMNHEIMTGADATQAPRDPVLYELFHRW